MSRLVRSLPAARAIARRATALAAAIVFAAPMAVLAAALPTPPAAAVKAITPAEVRKHLEFLASKELGGRYTLSKGNLEAANYLADRLKEYGFRGAMPDGSFLQNFEIVESQVDAAATKLRLTTGGKSTEYEYGDFTAMRSGPGAGSAQVVFVGYGVSAPDQGHDDYAKVDVKGKIVLFAPGVPKGVDAAKIAPEMGGAEAALARGAVATFSFVPPRYASFVKSPSFKEMIRSMTDVSVNQARSRIPAITLVGPSADVALGLLGLDIDGLYKATAAGEPLAPRPLDLRGELTVAIKETRGSARNVVAILEGADPKLRDEYVSFSAHFDHLKTSEKGEVYPGADDDGSGTAAILTIARAMSIERPKRSVFVIFHSGEEMGLLGSEYNTDIAPVIPLDRIVVNLNLDMIGRSKAPGDTNPKNAKLTGPNEIYLIGSDKLSQELHQISEQTNADFERLKINYLYNDANHPERFYYRSDHYNYAKHGIPIVFYFSGVHEDYHRPTDTIEKIDFEKAAKVTRLVFATGWRVANLDHRLKRDAQPAAAAATAK